MNWFAAAQVTFIPLRGKLSFFEKLFVDTDFYVFAGASLVGIEERANVRVNDGPALPGSANRGYSVRESDRIVCTTVNGVDARDACLVNSQGVRATRTALAPTFGAGLSMYFNDFIGLAIEWRGIPFKWNTSGTDERGPDGLFPDGAVNYRDRIRHFNHMMLVGIIVYLPTAPEITD